MLFLPQLAFLVFIILLDGPLLVAAISSDLQNILKNTHGSDAYSYPTDLTRDIIPIPVHSHNDYWRDIPFYSGLARGCSSTEADVWLINGTLYVGHDESSLTESRTLESLYINPMLEVLDTMNPETRFVSSPTKNGVWDTDPDKTLYFFIDAKTSGHETFQAVIDALTPLREKGYLTTIKNRHRTNGPITIIGTGNTPLNMVKSVSTRDYFFDAPLEALDKPEYKGITDIVSPIASTDFKAAIGTVESDEMPVLSDGQMNRLRSQVDRAKKRGIGARYWNAPDWPVRKRNLVWRTLLNEGVALLNVDDLDAVTGFF